MFHLWAGAIIEVSIPICISIIIVLTVFSDFYPGAFRILGHIISAVVELLEFFIFIQVHIHTIVCMVELVGESYIIIPGTDKISGSRILCPSETTVIGNFGFSFCCGTSRFSGNKYHTSRCFCSINGTRRCIFQYRNRFDIICIDLI